MKMFLPKRVPVADILWLFFGTRLLLIVGTYLSFILLPVPPHVYPSTPVDVMGLLTSWNHWDATRFLDIAQYGYRDVTDSPFFPLFPLLIRGIAWLCGNQGYLAIGMVLSNLALLGALVVLYQLATEALGPYVGRRTVLYLCIFPTAFFFFTSYNESLFLFLTSGTFLAMHRQKWWLAGLLGLLATLTRSAGLLLVLPYLYEVWASRERSLTTDPPTSFFQQVIALLPKTWPVILMPLGTFSYCLFCWRVFGNPLEFAAVQIRWGRVTAFPWQGILAAFTQIFSIQPFGSFLEAHLLIDTTATLGAIILAVASWRRLRPSYTLWISLLIFYMLLSPALSQADTLQSNQRFILEMFPAFLVLAELGLKYPRLHYACMLAFPFLQALMAALFVYNRWMV